MELAEKELERTLAASAESLLICDSAGRIVGVTDSLCALTGYERRDLLSKRIEDLADSEAGRLLAGLRGAATVDLEAAVRRKDGSTERLQIRLRPLRIGDRTHSLVRVARRRRASDRLPEDPEFIRAVLHAPGVLVVCVRTDGTVVFANPAFEELAGHPFPELRGRTVWDLVPNAGGFEALRRCLDTPGAPVSFEAVWEAPGAAARTFAWTGSPLAAAAPDPACLLLVGRELGAPENGQPLPALRRAPVGGARRDLEERISRLSDQLTQALAEHEGLTRALAHDFRGPLRALSGLSDALIEECARPSAEGEALRYALRISRSAQQMNALVENLLVYNRLWRMPVRLEAQALDLVVDEVLRTLDREIRERGARISVQGAAADVLADRSMLFLLLFQLLSNAIKFVRPGASPEVVLRAEARRDFVRVSVADNGIGIPSEYHRVIFGVGERLNPSESFRGTGMGLAIVARAAERLKGRVGVASCVGKGSEFWVELPRPPA
jgi:PAS domain S-box-containing protein